MSRSSTARVKKDILLELVSRDIKELQRAQSDTESSIDAFTNSEEQSQLLCDHMDHVLMHGLREFEDGYWPFVCYFTRNELVQKIARLKRVTTSLGKGRSWLYTALNEQSVESYVRMFAENQDIVEEFYLRDAFLRDIERLLLLLTLVSGLDFISFNLDMDCDYLDYGPSRLSSQIGSQGSIEVEPSFLSEKVGEVIRSRTSSDPTKRVATVISSVKQTKDVSSRRRDLSATSTTKTHNESENVLHGDIVPGNIIHSNRVSIPSSSIGSDEPRSTNPVMSSSLQMTSSRNFLERVGSLESSQSPFLGHAALGSGTSRDRMKKDRSKKDRDEEEDDVLVAKERKSGRSKRRRKKRNGENETSEATNSNKSSPTNIQYEGHVRKHESRMTKSDVSGITDSVSVTQLDTGENDTDSIPTRDHGNMGMEECDFETEPRHSIAGRRVSSEVIGTRREGEEEEGGMNLEMELALAAKDIQEDVLDSVQMDLKVGVVYGGSDNKSVFKKLANSDNIDKISEGVHQLEQPKVPRRDTKLPKSSGSLNPFEEEEPSPLSPLSPPTTHTSTRTRHTAPSDTGHHSHRVQSSHSEHPKSKLKVTREFGKPSRQRQTNRLDFDGDFDIITHKDMRELEGKRERANAVFTEGDREGGGE